MEYKYSKDDNFEDFACGRVLYHRSGMPSFPVRLADEIFKRCMEYLGRQNDIVLFDPCCGGGYLVTVLGLLNPSAIKEFVCSDIDEDAVGLARSNLSLLTMDGLLRRRDQIFGMIESFNKQSHRDALESADRIIKIVQDRPFTPEIKCLMADALDKMSFCSEDFKADIVMADVPYGNLPCGLARMTMLSICSWTLSVVPSMKIPSSPLYATSSRKSATAAIKARTFQSRQKGG